MTNKLVWDQIGEKKYETGVSKGVLFPVDDKGVYPKGVAWNGLSNVNDSPSGAEETKIYADNQKYLSLFSAEELGLTVEAYTYPDEFAECDGTAEIAPGVFAGQQDRKGFGFSYRTEVGNDIKGEAYGYKLHLVYGCKASPSEKSHGTINDSPEAVSFSWTITTTPVNVPGLKKPTASIEIDSNKVEAGKLEALEKIIYGFDIDEFDESKTYKLGDYVVENTKTYKCTTAVTTPGSFNPSDWTEEANAGIPRLPLPSEVITIMGGAIAG